MNKGNTALLFPSIPKRQVDFILHHLVLRKLRQQKLASSKAYQRKTNAYIIIQYYKSFRLIIRMQGAALALHKRQFIKKPKNPI